MKCEPTATRQELVSLDEKIAELRTTIQYITLRNKVLKRLCAEVRHTRTVSVEALTFTTQITSILNHASSCFDRFINNQPPLELASKELTNDEHSVSNANNSKANTDANANAKSQPNSNIQASLSNERETEPKFRPLRGRPSSIAGSKKQLVLAKRAYVKAPSDDSNNNNNSPKRIKHNPDYPKPWRQPPPRAALQREGAPPGGTRKPSVVPSTTSIPSHSRVVEPQMRRLQFPRPQTAQSRPSSHLQSHKPPRHRPPSSRSSMHLPQPPNILNIKGRSQTASSASIEAPPLCPRSSTGRASAPRASLLHKPLLAVNRPQHKKKLPEKQLHAIARTSIGPQRPSMVRSFVPARYSLPARPSLSTDKIPQRYRTPSTALAEPRRYSQIPAVPVSRVPLLGRNPSSSSISRPQKAKPPPSNVGRPISSKTRQVSYNHSLKRQSFPPQTSTLIGGMSYQRSPRATSVRRLSELPPLVSADGSTKSSNTKQRALPLVQFPRKRTSLSIVKPGLVSQLARSSTPHSSSASTASTTTSTTSTTGNSGTGDTKHEQQALIEEINAKSTDLGSANAN